MPSDGKKLLQYIYDNEQFSFERLNISEINSLAYEIIHIFQSIINLCNGEYSERSIDDCFSLLQLPDFGAFLNLDCAAIKADEIFDWIIEFLEKNKNKMQKLFLTPNQKNVLYKIINEKNKNKKIEDIKKINFAFLTAFEFHQSNYN